MDWIADFIAQASGWDGTAMAEEWKDLGKEEREGSLLAGKESAEVGRKVRLPSGGGLVAAGMVAMVEDLISKRTRKVALMLLLVIMKEGNQL